MECKVILLCIFAFFIAQIDGEFSSDDCWSLGFNKANLLCSTCDHLKDFKLDSLIDHCKECCQHDESSNAEKKYASAVLEVCTCKFSSYPQIQAFVKSNRPAKFPNLQIKYVRGLDPVIKLQDKDGNVREVIAIEKWNTDSVEEFLNTHLVSVAEDEKDYLKTNRI